MKKIKVLSLLSICLCSAISFAEEGDIYGYDILCKGKDGFTMTTKQSDDDLVMKATEDGKKYDVFASSSNDYDSEHMALLFVSDSNEKDQLAMALTRTKSRFEFVSGVARVNGNRHTVNCFVRFGTDEDNFEEISRKPFPKFNAPKID